MSEIDRRWFAERQIRLNRATEKNASLFAPHRRHVTDLALRAEGGPAAVLGAGNCNDVDLPTLASRFQEVHLVDLDGEALRGATLREPEEVRAKLVPHGGVDLSGLLDLLAGWDHAPPSPAEIDAAVGRRRAGSRSGRRARSLPLELPAHADDPVDRGSARGAAPTRRRSRARPPDGSPPAVARSLRRDGLGVIVSDMVSSDTVPGLHATPPGALRARMEALVRGKNFFTGANPYVLAAALTTQPDLAPLVRDVALVEPWLWQIAERRSYLVFAVAFRRTDRAAA